MGKIKTPTSIRYEIRNFAYRIIFYIPKWFCVYIYTEMWNIWSMNIAAEFREENKYKDS